MPGYLAVLTIMLLLGMVLIRVALLRRQGVRAMCFGDSNRSDFIILPFALFYPCTIMALAFGLPAVSRHRLLNIAVASWLGVAFCGVGLCLMLWGLVSFGRSFRVGIDQKRPDQLVTDGAFGWSRNPIYVAFASVLLGEFLIFTNWILLLYVVAGVWLFHRQVLREEAYLRRHYGDEFVGYCRRVRRYL